MNKNVKKSLIVIAIVILLFIAVWLMYDAMKEKPVDSKQTNANLVDENTGLDNFINGLFENITSDKKEENKVEENTAKEDKTDNNEEKEKNEAQEAGTSGESVTSKEERAVELVKKEWGETEGLYFSNDAIDTEGRYIVSVHDRSTTNTLAFFIVDVDSGLVTKK